MHQEAISRCFVTGENTQMCDFTSIKKQECVFTYILKKIGEYLTHNKLPLKRVSIHLIALHLEMQDKLYSA